MGFAEPHPTLLQPCASRPTVTEESLPICYDPRVSVKNRNLTWLALLLGLALLIGAIAMAARDVDWSQLQNAQPWQVAVLVLGVLLNLFLTGLLWWTVTLSFDAKPRVPVGRMLALVAASGLLNYLPLRPGLFGRAAYLKAKHNLPLRHSVLALFVVLGLSALVLGAAAAIAQFVPMRWYRHVGIAAALVITVLAPLIAGRMLKRKITAGWLWAPLRILDVLVTAIRLWAAFAVVGYDLSFDHAVLAAAGGSFIALLGVTPNGLGMREWAIAGITASSAGPVGFAAAVVDRAVEALVVLVVGLWSLAKLGLSKEATPSKEV